MQKGYVLGGIFIGVMRGVAPKLKQGLVNVGNRALKTGFESLVDVAAGGRFKVFIKNESTTKP